MPDVNEQPAVTQVTFPSFNCPQIKVKKFIF